MLHWEILIAVLMLSFSFFFSGMEIAFLTSSLLKIELKTAQGSVAARLLSRFKKHTSEVLITILIGNNLALVVFTMSMEDILAPFLEQYLHLTPVEYYLGYTLVQSVVATTLILILAEYIPKALFRGTADRIVYPSVWVLNFFYYLFWIPMQVVNAVSKVLLRFVFQVTTPERIVELGKKDLDLYIQEVIAAGDQAAMPDLNTEMLNNALAFKETKARECMIPRTEMVALPDSTTLEELMNTFIESRLSRIIIFGEDLDEVRGFIHSSSLFSKPRELKDLVQDVHVVPESMPANVLLGELIEDQRSVALVVDEYGGTSGMVTIEDLVEEVFGEIEDEYDVVEIEEDNIKVANDDGSYLLGGRLEIDDINEEFDLELPEEEYYTTLGGLVTYYAGDIPKRGTALEVGPYRLTVAKAAPNRVIAVRLIHQDS